MEEIEGAEAYLRAKLRNDVTDVLLKTALPKSDLLDEIIAAAATAAIVFQTCTEQQAVHKFELALQSARKGMETINSGVNWTTDGSIEA
jgi:hypothetical protein